jgi:hypothetical protein
MKNLILEPTQTWAVADCPYGDNVLSNRGDQVDLTDCDLPTIA